MSVGVKDLWRKILLEMQVWFLALHSEISGLCEPVLLPGGWVFLRIMSGWKPKALYWWLSALGTLQVKGGEPEESYNTSGVAKVVICKGGVEILSLVVVCDAEVLIFINYCVRAQPAGFEHQWLLMCDTQQSLCPLFRFNFQMHHLVNTVIGVFVFPMPKKGEQNVWIPFLGELLKLGLLSWYYKPAISGNVKGSHPTSSWGDVQWTCGWKLVLHPGNLHKFQCLHFLLLS